MDPVQAQLDAYNARDLEAFVACYAPDVVMEDGQGQVMLRGHEAMRGVYGRLFSGSPELNCRLVSRIRVGPYVLDEERVTGFGGPGEVHAVAVYRVEDDLIVHVRMLR